MQNIKYIKTFFLLISSCLLLKATEDSTEISNPGNQDWFNRKLLKFVSKDSYSILKNIGVTLALRCGADPNSRDQFSLTCLHYASLHNNSKQIRQLVTARANIDVVDRYGSSPLCYAILGGKDNAAHEIINQIKNIYKNSSTEYLQRKNGFNLTPLHLAVSFNRLPIVQRLLSLGVNPDGISNSTEPINSRTPLHCAAEISNFNLIEILLSYGADKDVIDPLQGTIFDVLRKKDIPHSRDCLERLNKILACK